MTCCSFIANHSLQFNSTCIFSTMIEVFVLFICNRKNGLFNSTLKMDFPPSSGLISCVDLIKLLWWTQIFKLLVEAEQWTKPLKILKSHKRCRLQESTSTMSELWKKGNSIAIIIIIIISSPSCQWETLGDLRLRSPRVSHWHEVHEVSVSNVHLVKTMSQSQRRGGWAWCHKLKSRMGKQIFRSKPIILRNPCIFWARSLLNACNQKCWGWASWPSAEQHFFYKWWSAGHWSSWSASPS